MKIQIAIIFGLLSFNLYSQKMEKILVDGIEVEVHRNYYETGELNQEWLQTLYELHGYQKTFYKNGKLKEIQDYRENNWTGVDTRYFENGKIQKETKKINDSLFLSIEYFENGNKKSEYQLTNKKQEVGNRKDYFENGNICLQIEYFDNSFLNGNHVSFYENFDICLKGKYENGIFKVVDFFDSKREQTLNNGTGFIETIQNGKLLYFDSYKNGLREGMCKIYSNEGFLKNEGTFKNGKSEGKSIWYKPNGEIEEIIYMENDVMTYREKK